MDQFREKVATYRQRVSDFMDQARGWCAAHGLRVEEIATPVLESYVPQYEARAIRILIAVEDGWYWYEASIRKAKRVDEALFLDLITDVSDHEFHCSPKPGSRTTCPS